MISTVLGVTIKYSLEETKQQFTESMQTTANLLAEQSRVALLTGEYDDLQPYIEQLTKNPAIDSIALTNMQGLVVVSNKLNLIGSRQIAFESTDSLIVLNREISNTAGILGNLAIRYSIQKLIQINKDVLNLGIKIALLGMTLIAFIGIGIGFFLTRNLGILSTVAEDLASGSMNARTNFSGHDEVAVVGRAFDQMAENVASNVAALKRATELLEQRVNERTEDLAIAKEDAENASRAKSSFLANMSHEIRTPLTSIIGHSETLLNSNMSLDDRVESINTVIRSGKHLLQIINDILDLSKIEADRLEPEIINANLFDMVRDIESITRLNAENKGLSFKIEYSFPLPATIHTDPLRLKQILINLCNNAVKFTSEGSVRIKISCDCDSQKMQFRVIDTGIGLNREQLKNLFTQFTQADASTTRRYGGTGLGLYLSRQLANKLGGDISVESTPEVGSCFTLHIDTGELDSNTFITTVPATDLNDNLVNRTAPPKLSGKILLAEDNPDNQRLISMFIRNTGAELVIAANGQEVLDKVQHENFDLILMDTQMPLLSGLEATQKLRAMNYAGPIVSLTANVMRADIEACLQAGCNEYLSKPIEHDNFYATLAKYLKPRTEHLRDVSPIFTSFAEQGPEFHSILQVFIDRLPTIADRIKQSFHASNIDELKGAVHDLKGTSGNFGYTALYELSRRVEFEIASKNMQVIATLIDDMDDLIQRIMRGFEQQEQQRKRL